MAITEFSTDPELVAKVTTSWATVALASHPPRSFDSVRDLNAKNRAS